MRHSLFVTAACLVAIFAAAPSLSTARAAEGQDEFARATIDLGVVVSDVDKAAKFYTEAIGFKELDGFRVPADFATRAGLTDQQPLAIRVFALSDADTATKLKLMHVPGVNSKASDNATVHSQLGFSYITIHVKDMTTAVARLEKAGVKILAEGPAALPASLGEGVYLTVVRDPDGNLVELVGPKK